MDKLLEYLNSLAKDARAPFAERCGTTEGYLRKAASTGQLLGTTTCVLIEQESGKAVTRKDLHPDDWQAHWPELANEAMPGHAKNMSTNAEQLVTLGRKGVA